MSIPSRGYLAAGLAAAVVGSLGFALNAGADEVADAPAPAAAEASVDPDAAAAVPQTGEYSPTPPPLLPWGDEPEPGTAGPVNATSAQLAAMGADYAPQPGPSARSGYKPKGTVFSKRTRWQGRTPVPPQPPSTALLPSTALAPKAPEVNFFYSSAEQFTESDGSYANIVIDSPDLAPQDAHSLAEIAVRSWDETGSQHTVEVGWTVDRLLNKDEDPHLFVYYWVDGKGKCYNAECAGWVQNPASKVAPGALLPEKTAKRFGIEFVNNAWWIAYDSQWIGHFPASLWGGRFTKTGVVQWFGEVASPFSRPCSQMGTGVVATDTANAARFGTISLINSKDAPVANIPGTVDGVNSLYPPVKTNDRVFRFGGPAVSGGSDPACKPKDQ